MHGPRASGACVSCTPLALVLRTTRADGARYSRRRATPLPVLRLAFPFRGAGPSVPSTTRPCARLAPPLRVPRPSRYEHVAAGLAPAATSIRDRERACHAASETPGCDSSGGVARPPAAFPAQTPPLPRVPPCRCVRSAESARGAAALAALTSAAAAPTSLASHRASTPPPRKPRSQRRPRIRGSLCARGLRDGRSQRRLRCTLVEGSVLAFVLLRPNAPHPSSVLRPPPARSIPRPTASDTLLASASPVFAALEAHERRL
ncbi:hypothetical protein B0H15DRAFT_948677 [Mycena belliarum]|uniref:Uncharacterized protein n=1 Tax=Mycena belliarum TaxID=1033014 RepID=A0AAD6U534_9AGAR|nr:hypothetical protein B0H15DRAFT_948677 [Mycena belliae]